MGEKILTRKNDIMVTKKMKKCSVHLGHQASKTNRKRKIMNSKMGRRQKKYRKKKMENNQLIQTENVKIYI